MEGKFPSESTEELLEVIVTIRMSDPPSSQDLQDFIRTTVIFETSAKRDFDYDGDYLITCEHPPLIEQDKEFKIISKVLRSITPILFEKVYARISISRENDPAAETWHMYFPLSDNGEEWSGDEHANDGIYTTLTTPSELHVESGTGISVICNLVVNVDGYLTDNNFFG